MTVALGPGRRVADPDGLLASRYDLAPGTTYLFRPDQHVAARWRGFDVVDQLDGNERTIRFLTRLCFILANQIGDRETLHGAIEAAKACAVPDPPAAR